MNIKKIVFKHIRLSLPFYPFLIKKYYNYIAILSTLESTFLDKTIRSASNCSFQLKEFVNLKCMKYAQYIPLPLNRLSSTSQSLHYDFGLKVLATIPYFNFHFFPHLLIFLQFRDRSLFLPEGDR